MPRALSLIRLQPALIAGLALLAAWSAMPRAQAQAPSTDAVLVELDHARVVRLPEKVQTIIVGNPSIADVSIQKNGIMIVTGKSYGVTNLIALDPAGNMIVDTTIRVQGPRDAHVVVHRGLERESYSCAPSCQPTATMGDVQRHFDGAVGQIGARNGLAGRTQ